MLSQADRGRSKEKAQFSLPKAGHKKVIGLNSTVPPFILELRESNERYAKLFQLAPFAYMTVNKHDFMVDINRRASTLLALRGSISNSREFKSLIVAEDQGKYMQARKALIETGAPQVCELRFVRRSTFFWGHLELAGEWERGLPLFRAGIVDITANKDAESKLKQAELQHKLALSENQIQLREAFHRMKNNLQVISGLLRMQAEVLQDSVAAGALNECHCRVLSMALIHERLSLNGMTSAVDFGDLSALLTRELFKSFGSPKRIRCRLNTRPVILHPEQAIPCGLILNELLTNAFKYAYPAETEGEICVALRASAHGRVKLTVSDKGVGFPQGFDWKSATSSLGLTIIEALTQQLGGKLVVGTGPGASFTVQFSKSV